MSFLSDKNLLNMVDGEWLDYILKPFITEEFIDKLTKSMLHIMIGQEQDQELKEQKAFADIGTQSMRDSYLLD